MLRWPFRVVTAGRLLATGLILAIVTAAILWLVPSSDYVFLPDRAHPVAPLVKVPGGHPPARGGVYFVDVIVRKASLLEQLFGGLHSGATLYPASEVVPPAVTGAQEQTVDQDEMLTSQQIAAAVALRAAGRKVIAAPAGAVVAEVEPGMPAAGKLVPTDVIVRVDGRRVRTPDDVTRAMRGKKPGDRVSFVVHRGNSTKTFVLKTAADPHQRARAIVGVYLDAQPYEKIELPIPVSIDAGGVGGPSAGLAFALDVLQQLGHNVVHGHKIAATGQIFLDGRVGPIGGVEQKTIGAREAGVDAFLVPAGENARDARRYAHGLRIIPVKSFQQALRSLATLPRISKK